MAQAPGVSVPAPDAEATRRRLLDAGLLRTDLRVMKRHGDVVFPVTAGGDGTFEFQEVSLRPTRYQDLLEWPETERGRAPRAFDAFGDIIVVKVPKDLMDRRAEIGRALMAFHPGCRAVFHDAGVKGPYRVRDLHRIAGSGGTETTLVEHGVRLVVDPARAYYSPRLSDERARVVAQLEPGMHVVDLFSGVAPLGVLAAKAGAVVDCVDLNPDAVALARDNVARNGVADQVTVHEGDAREVALRLEPADHVVMNLPHGAKDFVDVAVPLVRPGGLLHYHEILPDADLKGRCTTLAAQIKDLGRDAKVAATRHVRTYATGQSHYAIDVQVD